MSWMINHIIMKWHIKSLIQTKFQRWFSSTTVEVMTWMSNYTPQKTMEAVTYTGRNAVNLSGCGNRWAPYGNYDVIATGKRLQY